MFLSVVIPTYNRAYRIKASIMSILSQGFDDVEVVVVDDGSEDNTEGVVADLKNERIKFVRIENGERGAARNVGTKLARGDYVNFFDSDDIMAPCLHALKEFIDTNAHPDVIYGEIAHQTKNSGKHEVFLPPYKSFIQNLLHNNFLACGSVFLKREIAVLFPFSEDRSLSSAEDWELWLRIAPHYHFTHFPEVVFTQVHHEDRSIIKIDPTHVEIRDTLFADVVRGNSTLIKFVRPKAIRLFVADRFTFIALSWISSDRRKALHYTLKSFTVSFQIVRRRRFWALVKKLVIQ